MEQQRHSQGREEQKRVQPWGKDGRGEGRRDGCSDTVMVQRQAPTEGVSRKAGMGWDESGERLFLESAWGGGEGLRGD